MDHFRLHMRGIMEYTQSNLSKITETYLLFKQNLTATRGQAERAHSSFQQVADEFKLTDKRILELGGGSRGALLQMFDETNDAVGIDKYLGAIDRGYLTIWYCWHSINIFDPVFYRNLNKINGGYLNRKREVISMDAMDMDFADNGFDFVYSRFFLEHIEDIRRLAEEIRRVLKPGGKTYHVFALYTTLDGAHTLDWQRYDPWQHLTGRVEGNAYINKYRIEYYIDAFERSFGKGNVEMRTRIDESSRKYLTQQLRTKLNTYSDEELLTTSPVIVATKA